MNAAMPKPASLALRTLIPAAAAARSFERTASIRCPRLDAPHVGDEQAEQDRRGEDEEAEDRARDLVVQASEGRVGAKVEPTESGWATGEPVDAAAPARVREAELLERDRRRERDDREADAADAQSGDRDEQPDDRGDGGPDQERDRELRPDAADVGRQVRHREAGDAGERELHDGDLADEADDHDEREADDDAEQRVDQRLPEVVREHDQRDGADDGAITPA